MANVIITKGSGFFSIYNSFTGQETTTGDYPLNCARFIYYTNTVVIKNIYNGADIVPELAYTAYINGSTGQNFVNAAAFKAYVQRAVFASPCCEKTLTAPVLTAGTPGASNIPLTLTAVPYATQYIIQRAADSGFTTGLTQVYAGPATAFNDTGLPANTTFYYRAMASAQGDGYLNSEWSNAVIATTQENYSHIYNVGTGSGNLTIDGNSATYIDNSLIVIAPGTYGTINIQNLNPSTKITIKNGGGVVEMDGGNYPGGSTNIYAGLNYSNCSNLLISGNGSADAFGFYFHDNSYRPTSLSGVNKNVTLQYVSYKNIGDYPIVLYGSSAVWNGTNASIKNMVLKFLHNQFDNCNGTIQLGGQVTTTQVTDLTKNIEFGYNNWINCDAGNLVFAGATDAMDIHDNTFSNINASNNNDNGFFLLIGNADYYRNYANSYQGHAIRLWSISFGSTPAECLIYDNINIGSRKYSPFEWQSTEGLNVVAAPNTTYVNIKLCNNTAGDLNYEQHTSFGACLVDNYAMPAGSTQQVYNNMLYNTFTATGINHRIFQFSDLALEAKAIANKNIYYVDDSAAGFDEVSLTLSNTSPAKNAGLSGHLIDPLDYHRLPFNIPAPSIGAVQ